jgi:hypothetical protein
MTSKKGRNGVGKTTTAQIQRLDEEGKPVGPWIELSEVEEEKRESGWIIQPRT